MVADNISSIGHPGPLRHQVIRGDKRTNPRKKGETLIEERNNLETCLAINRLCGDHRPISYGSILPVEIPPEEISRAQRFFHGKEPKSSTLSNRLKKRMLALYDGKRCPTCHTVMRHNRGIKFGHEIADAATIEHVIPIAMGGSSEETNLVVRCNLCNRASGHTMNEWLQQFKEEPTWDSARRMILYLWLETHDTTLAEALYPQLYDAFMRKREQLRQKQGRRD